MGLLAEITQIWQDAVFGFARGRVQQGYLRHARAYVHAPLL